ncbi:MAG: WD40 repeat domain-containing protein, partial [Actinomycetota bacterium]|nr:WD40 repeat domain-containing protein [Actinomycetota bacterium]
FSTATGKLELGPIRVHDGAVWDLAFSDDGRQIASGGDDGDVEVIDASTGERVHSLAVSDLPVTSLLYDGQRLITGGDDAMVRIWDGQALTDELRPQANSITAMAIDPDGALAVADRAGGVQILNLESGESEIELKAEENTIWGLSWSTDGRTLAAASADERVQLWDVEEQAPIGSLGYPGGALDVAFLEDGATIAATSGDGSVRLWDSSVLEPLGSALEGHSGKAVWRVVALPGMRFASSSEGGTVHIWDVLNPNRACERAAGPLGIASLEAFLGDGEARMACTDGDF